MGGTPIPCLTLEEARSAIAEVVAELVDLDTRLGDLAASVPDPQFEEGTDAPANEAGQLYGLIVGAQQDELSGLIRTLRRAAQVGTGETA